MANDPNVYKSPVRAIGNVEEDAATNSTDSWSIVALLKGLYHVLAVTGITVTGGTLATSAKQDTGNVSLASIDTKLTTLNFSTDTLESALGIVTETAPATDTASSGLNGRMQRVAQRLTALIAQIPATLGVKARTASLSVAMATEDAALFPASLGAKAAASSFAVTQSTEDAAQLGSLTETAPASDTASSGLNGRLQRIAQRITSLIALVPTSLGAKTAANSFAITTATDDATIALYGAVTETAPATDTASSGLNGRLQRVAQRITSLIALVPASLGQKAMASAFAVSIASDQTTVPVSPGSSALTGGIPSTARLLSAVGTSGDAANVKASAGRLYAIQGYNASSSVRYLKLYNSASAPTAGSGTPVKTLALPPLAAFAFDWAVGLTFSTGIGFTLVTGSADNSSSGVTAADIVGLNLDYA